MRDVADPTAAFLASVGWAGAKSVPLAGDASNRRYDRLHRGARTAVLMHAPPSKGEDTAPFVRVARYLAELGLSAPDVFGVNAQAGLVLLEDLGDDLFARLCDRDQSLEPGMYQAAVDVLVTLHKHSSPDWAPPFGADEMPALSALAVEWYSDNSTEAKDALLAALDPHIDALNAAEPVLVLRDFHAENLIWLPNRRGVARVGLLDFQDAGKGHPGYDLVSLLDDARRDVPRDLADALIARYCDAAGHDLTALRLDLTRLTIQRNLRILGVFARLCLRDAKPGYVDLIPRVWGHLHRALAHPDMAELRKTIAAILPEPTNTHLDRLRAACGTRQTPL